MQCKHWPKQQGSSTARRSGGASCLCFNFSGGFCFISPLLYFVRWKQKPGEKRGLYFPCWKNPIFNGILSPLQTSGGGFRGCCIIIEPIRPAWFDVILQIFFNIEHHHSNQQCTQTHTFPHTKAWGTYPAQEQHKCSVRNFTIDLLGWGEDVLGKGNKKRKIIKVFATNANARVFDFWVRFYRFLLPLGACCPLLSLSFFHFPFFSDWVVVECVFVGRMVYFLLFLLCHKFHV